MRPLYVDGCAGCRVVFEAPALRVTLPDKADQLFPLSRLSRVVCRGVVDWSMSALLACADAGIVLVFLHQNGEQRAHWVGRTCPSDSLEQRLVDVLSRCDGLSSYENWLRSIEKQAVRSFARRIGLDDWREVSVSALTVDVDSHLDQQGRRAKPLLKSLLYSELLVLLPACGWDITDETYIACNHDMVEDVSGLLLWDFYPALLHRCRNNMDVSLPTLALLVDQRADAVYLLLRNILNKLHKFILTNGG